MEHCQQCGNTWADHNTNLSITQFYHGSIHSTNPNFLRVEVRITVRRNERSERVGSGFAVRVGGANAISSGGL